MNRKKLRVMCFCAALTALSAVIAYFCKMFFTFTPSVRLTFENLPIIFAGYMLGPLPGLLTGLCSDVLSTAVSQYGIGGINPLVTLGAGTVGLLAGFLPRVLPKHFPRVLTLGFSVFISHFVGNVLIKSAGLYIMYSYPLPALLPRIPLYAAIAAAEFIILIILTKNKGIKKVLYK